jgi:hypothetical protein
MNVNMKQREQTQTLVLARVPAAYRERRFLSNLVEV